MEESTKNIIANNRAAMKSAFAAGKFDSDQKKGLPQPEPFKVCGGECIPLSKEFESLLKKNDYLGLLNDRVTRRAYTDKPLTLVELSFLLWSAQGVRSVRSNLSFRVVPSGGARHPFEVYLAVKNVEGLEKGLYHYLAQTHELELLRPLAEVEKELVGVLNSQSFTETASVTLFFAAISYRPEWRYASAAGKLVLLDAGHAVQNLYLSCEALELGMCAIAAYDQPVADAFFGLDGVEEFVVYAAAIGTVF